MSAFSRRVPARDGAPEQAVASTPLWTLMNTPLPVDVRATRLACSILLVAYGAIVIMRYETGLGEFFWPRLAICAYAALGIASARRMTWQRIRAYTVGLAFLLPLQAAYVNGLLGNRMSEVAVTALATFAPLVFLQTGRDYIVVCVGLAIGHAVLLWTGPEPHVPRSVVALFVGAGLATGATLGLVMVLYRVRWVDAVRRLEGALATSAAWKNRYEAASLGSGHVLYDREPYTGVVRYGGACERILGYTAGELGGGLSQWVGLIHPDDRPRFRETCARCVDTKEPAHDEYRVRRKDGTWIIVEDTGHVVHDDTGQVVSVVGFVADVTERRRAEVFRAAEAETSAALARVGQELISSLETPVLIERLCRLTTDVLGCDLSQTWLVNADDETYRLLSCYGTSDEEWQALKVVRLPSDPSSPLIARLIREEVALVSASDTAHPLTRSLMAHHGVACILCVGLRRRGEMVGVHIAGYRERPGLPAPAFTAQQEGIARGIAQLASMAISNAHLVEELERASRLKSEFVSTMSHELRTPLNVILGYTDMLGDLVDGTEAARIIQRVRQSSLELLELVEATLNVNRIAEGKETACLDTFALDDLIEELRGEFELLPRAPGVQLVWRAEDGLTLHSDRRKLKIVLKNLVGNALKFTLAGQVAVDVERREGTCVVTVRDTGVGMAADQVPHIFEMFRQVDSSETRRFGGVGLGLYIVQSLLEQLGGTIDVESEPGVGSTFRCSLPVEAHATAEAAPAPESSIAV